MNTYNHVPWPGLRVELLPDNTFDDPDASTVCSVQQFSTADYTDKHFSRDSKRDALLPTSFLLLCMSRGCSHCGHCWRLAALCHSHDLLKLLSLQILHFRSGFVIHLDIFPEVGAQLVGRHVALAVADQQDGVTRVECDAREAGLLGALHDEAATRQRNTADKSILSIQRPRRCSHSSRARAYNTSAAPPRYPTKPRAWTQMPSQLTANAKDMQATNIYCSGLPMKGINAHLLRT